MNTTKPYPGFSQGLVRVLASCFKSSVLSHEERGWLCEDATLSIAWRKGRMNMMYHKCFYKYIIETSNPLATRPRYSRTCGAYWENLSKFWSRWKHPERNGPGLGCLSQKWVPIRRMGMCFRQFYRCLMLYKFNIICIGQLIKSYFVMRFSHARAGG